jgi:ABC-type sulfate transport system substrate-binding protein
LAGTGILRNPPESSRILRNPPASGGFRGKYRNSWLTGIPANKSCDSKKKQEFLRPLQNHISVKNSSRKNREKRNPQEYWQERFVLSKK